MTPLRQKMIDLMTVKNLSPLTQKSYLSSVYSLTKYFHVSPDQLSQDDIQQYLIHLMKEKKLAANTCRLQLHGILFLFRNVLKRPDCQLVFHYPKCSHKIPELLTRAEALRIVNAPDNLKHRTQLQICYSCGLRVSEVVGLRVKDIDGARRLLKIEQGKGAKDRLVPISPTLLTLLRVYWKNYRPQDKLFYLANFNRATGVSSVQKLYRRSKVQVGVDKRGGIHALRHAYATHQLESGLPIHLLQRWLGHTDIHTTMRYIHWVPNYQAGQQNFADLLDEDMSHDRD